MRRPRMTLAGLMVLVLVAGVGIAALRDATETWSRIIHLLAWSWLGVAILGVIYRRGSRQAWWLGFALFGWGYAAVALTPWSKPERLATTDLLGALYERVSTSRVVAIDSFALQAGVRAGDYMVIDTEIPQGAMPGADASMQVVRIGTADLRSFRAIGHGLFALVAGVVGALIARWFHASRGPAASHDGSAAS